MEPQLTGDFFRAVVDSISESLCVIDREANIVYVNASWRAFSRQNGGRRAKPSRPVNYLRICERAADHGDEHAIQTAAGLRQLIRGEVDQFSLEYPCHSPHKKRWFILSARPMAWNGEAHFVIEHTDITQRKLAELEVQQLSLTDRLTGLANRRHFDAFLDQTWDRHMRHGLPLSLILLDVDHFKRLNDTHGHLTGDACLASLARLLSRHVRRAGDLAARYGGEEMALILPGIGEHDAAAQAEIIRREIEGLGGQVDAALDLPALTASFGVATTIPRRGSHAHSLIAAADRALYQAKREGRNRVRVAISEQAA